MNAQLKAAARQYDKASPDEAPQLAYEAAATALLADADRLKELDVIASEELDGDTYTAMFVTLANASDSGLIQRLAEGDAVGFCFAGQVDAFARLAKLADSLAAVRKAAIKAAIESDLETL